MIFMPLIVDFVSFFEKMEDKIDVGLVLSVVCS